MAPLLASMLSGCGLALGPAPTRSPETSPTAAAKPPASAKSVATSAVVSYPYAGSGQWRAAAGSQNAAGTGRLWRYTVEVETDIHNIEVNDFAEAVTKTLNDPRGWTAGGQIRMMRVNSGEPHEFTVYLVTPATRDKLCADSPEGYTSCRNGSRVVLNIARWINGVPNYGADLAEYRQYMVNHEVGHRLGHDHELCPGVGQPAPIMQQQTLGLHGCRANPWPYIHNKRYSGTPGVYNDPIPADLRNRQPTR